MAIHDAYPRRTPYELALPGDDFIDDHLEAIREEAEDRGSAVESPDALMLLGTAGRAHRALAPPDADPGALPEYGALLFHAYHFWRTGGRVHLVSAGVARFAAEASAGAPAPAGEGDRARLPAEAGYLQLPRNLFWARAIEDGPAEAVDGFFWSAPAGTFHALLALGMRGDRPGLSVVPLPAGRLDDLDGWAAVDARPDGKDFESTLPGGEIDRLYSLETTGEGLKLVARLLAYAARAPGGGEEVRPPEEPPEDGPPPSELPATRITVTAENSS